MRGCQWALSIRPNIPVWNSGNSMRRMEQYFPVRWTTQSQVIRFKFRAKIRDQTDCSFIFVYLLDDSEVEKNDVLGEGDNITFIVRSPQLHLRYLSIFLTGSRVTFEWRASCSPVFTRAVMLTLHVALYFSHYSLKLVRLIHCNNVALRYFNRLSDRGLVFRLEAWGQARGN